MFGLSWELRSGSLSLVKFTDMIEFLRFFISFDKAVVFRLLMLMFVVVLV